MQSQSNNIISKNDILNQKIIIEKRYANENLNNYLNQNLIKLDLS